MTTLEQLEARIEELHVKVDQLLKRRERRAPSVNPSRFSPRTQRSLERVRVYFSERHEARATDVYAAGLIEDGANVVAIRKKLGIRCECRDRGWWWWVVDSKPDKVLTF